MKAHSAFTVCHLTSTGLLFRHLLDSGSIVSRTPDSGPLFGV